MAICGDLRVSAAPMGFRFKHPFGASLPPSKVRFKHFTNGGSDSSEIMPKWSCMEMERYKTWCHYNQPFGVTGANRLPMEPITQDAEGFLHKMTSMSFFERLNLAWKILFPSPTTRRNSNARIAKQRLKMILFSDRCVVSDDAKQKIVSNIVGALSEFVEIDSQDKVHLNVSTDPDLGTVYSITVPVRRVKSEYQDEDEDEDRIITNIEYKDTGERSDSVDVRFDFFVPNENSQ